MSDQLNARVTSETTRTLKTIHIIHSHIHSKKVDMRKMIMTAKMIFGDLVGLKLSDICVIREENPRKNLTQETCPDLRSNPGPLRDRRLLHCGGP